MESENTHDTRLAMAYQLLRGLLEQNGEEPDDHQQPWELPFVPPENPSGIMSATDLLTWWFRPASRMADPWDNYFGPRTQPINGAPSRAQVERRSWSPGAYQVSGNGAARSRQEPARELRPWVDWQLLYAQPENALEDEHAEAAVQCLYDFLHAISRRDVEGAMQLVADDYHVLEDDMEIDSLALRHQIERLLDSLRGWELQVAPVEIPNPLMHVLGVLIYVEIQVDAYHPLMDLRRVIVLPRVAVLQWQSKQGWRLSALSPV